MKKQGISLIVLVITIIVMIILAATIIISLNNTGIIGAAENAVCMTNIKQAQNLAVLKWAELYTKGERDTEVIKEKIKEEFNKNKLNADDYNIEVTTGGVEVSSKAGCIDSSGVESGSGVVGGDEIDPNWIYSYTYTDADGWSDKIKKADVNSEVSGKIVARFYETGETVSYEDMDVPEGPAYKMVITGTGNLKLGDINDEGVPTETYAWFTETFNFLKGDVSQFIMAYVTDVEIQKGIDCIGTAAFYAGFNLKNVVISNSVTVIDDSAFAMCQSLEGIILPDSIEKIGSAFGRCVSLTNLTLPNGLKEIGYNAFFGCEKLTLTSPVLPQGITKIGERAFAECESLTKLVLPEGIKTIPYSCFEYCDGLEEVVVSEGTETIIEYAFGNCDIKTITLPKSLQTVERLAFTNSSIATINFAGTQEEWNALGSINLPANVTIVYNYTGN